MNKWLLVFIVPSLLGGYTACEGGGERLAGKDKAEDALAIVLWNVQAVFDGKADGIEYKEYTNGWTQEKYLARLNMIGEALDSIGTTPEVLALVEVENADILEDLSKGALVKHGYHWTFFGNNAGAALGVGVLSKLPFTKTQIHSAHENGLTMPRPVLEAHVTAEGRAIVLFLCHWKSKLGGDAETEPSRRLSARVIARRIREIHAEAPDTPVIVMGDLNENHDEFFRQDNVYVTALMPDHPAAAEAALGLTDFLVISENKPPTSAYFSCLALYSPWAEIEGGSYNYKGKWETIDHFLLNSPLFDEKDWDFDSCEVIRQAPFLNKHGTPAYYNPNTGDGLSDHLPLLLTLRNKEHEER
ncbi:MAG: endonuclease/exonuclease/phosphatase family protein [Treponema sp.]|jgi:endonuclease/exonuclease/phosphatase family metal-dependent hydrolase|nr:endonuclease/exonuclease/phosphatase family protein [Treponema sp.]